MGVPGSVTMPGGCSWLEAALEASAEDEEEVLRLLREGLR